MFTLAEYFWYNGKMDYLLVTDKIDPNSIVKVNSVQGDMNDSDSRITPFKVHRGRQPYDAGNMTMAIPHLFGKDNAAYWKGYDWDKSIKVGMAAANVPYSGKYGFVETEYHYPITHMVAPKERTLTCGTCHAKDGRLANLAGFYMPGRDSSSTLDFIGWFAVIAALIGVFAHGLLRAVSKPKGQ